MENNLLASDPPSLAEDPVGTVKPKEKVVREAALGVQVLVCLLNDLHDATVAATLTQRREFLEDLLPYLHNMGFLALCPRRNGSGNSSGLRGPSRSLGSSSSDAEIADFTDKIQRFLLDMCPRPLTLPSTSPKLPGITSGNSELDAIDRTNAVNGLIHLAAATGSVRDFLVVLRVLLGANDYGTEAGLKDLRLSSRSLLTTSLTTEELLPPLVNSGRDDEVIGATRPDSSKLRSGSPRGKRETEILGDAIQDTFKKKAIAKGIKAINSSTTAVNLAMSSPHHRLLYSSPGNNLVNKQRTKDELKDALLMNASLSLDMSKMKETLTRDSTVTTRSETPVTTARCPRFKTLNVQSVLVELDRAKPSVPTRGKPTSSFPSGFSTDTTVFIEVEGEREVWSCGQNSYGELGHGDTASPDGKVLTCGYNDNGQCGHGGTARVSHLSEIPKMESSISQVHAYNGCEHTLLVTMDGRAATCGYNYRGQLGHGNTTSESVPKIIRSLEAKIVRLVSCSYYHTVMACEDGSQQNLYTFGRNDYGQLGHNDSIDRKIPQLVDALSDQQIVSVACGQYHTMVVSATGKAFAFGKNDYGQLGIESMENQLVPVQVRGGLERQECLEIRCGYYHTIALCSGAHLFAFGRNDYGQLGLGRPNATSAANLQLQQQRFSNARLIDELEGKDIVRFACGCYHTIAVSDNGVMYVFGRNNHGQLGTGDTNERIYPFPIDDFVGKRVALVAAGFYHTIVLTGGKDDDKNEQESSNEREDMSTFPNGITHTTILSSPIFQELLDPVRSGFNGSDTGAEVPAIDPTMRISAMKTDETQAPTKRLLRSRKFTKRRRRIAEEATATLMQAFELFFPCQCLQRQFCMHTMHELLRDSPEHACGLLCRRDLWLFDTLPKSKNLLLEPLLRRMTEDPLIIRFLPLVSAALPSDQLVPQEPDDVKTSLVTEVYQLLFERVAADFSRRLGDAVVRPSPEFYPRQEATLKAFFDTLGALQKHLSSWAASVHEWTLKDNSLVYSAGIEEKIATVVDRVFRLDEQDLDRVPVPWRCFIEFALAALGQCCEVLGQVFSMESIPSPTHGYESVELGIILYTVNLFEFSNNSLFAAALLPSLKTILRLLDEFNQRDSDVQHAEKIFVENVANSLSSRTPEKENTGSFRRKSESNLLTARVEDKTGRKGVTASDAMTMPWHYRLEKELAVLAAEMAVTLVIGDPYFTYEGEDGDTKLSDRWLVSQLFRGGLDSKYLTQNIKYTNATQSKHGRVVQHTPFPVAASTLGLNTQPFSLILPPSSDNGGTIPLWQLPTDRNYGEIFRPEVVRKFLTSLQGSELETQTEASAATKLCDWVRDSYAKKDPSYRMIIRQTQLSKTSTHAENDTRIEAACFAVLLHHNSDLSASDRISALQQTILDRCKLLLLLNVHEEQEHLNLQLDEGYIAPYDPAFLVSASSTFNFSASSTKRHLGATYADGKLPFLVAFPSSKWRKIRTILHTITGGKHQLQRSLRIRFLRKFWPIFCRTSCVFYLYDQNATGGSLSTSGSQSVGYFYSSLQHKAFSELIGQLTELMTDKAAMLMEPGESDATSTFWIVIVLLSAWGIHFNTEQFEFNSSSGGDIYVPTFPVLSGVADLLFNEAVSISNRFLPLQLSVDNVKQIETSPTVSVAVRRSFEIITLPQRFSSQSKGVTFSYDDMVSPAGSETATAMSPLLKPNEFSVTTWLYINNQPVPRSRMDSDLLTYLVDFKTAIALTIGNWKWGSSWIWTETEALENPDKGRAGWDPGMNNVPEQKTGAFRCFDGWLSHFRFHNRSLSPIHVRIVFDEKKSPSGLLSDVNDHSKLVELHALLILVSSSSEGIVHFTSQFSQWMKLIWGTFLGSNSAVIQQSALRVLSALLPLQHPIEASKVLYCSDSDAAVVPWTLMVARGIHDNHFSLDVRDNVDQQNDLQNDIEVRYQSSKRQSLMLANELIQLLQQLFRCSNDIWSQSIIRVTSNIAQNFSNSREKEDSEPEKYVLQFGKHTLHLSTVNFVESVGCFYLLSGGVEFLRPGITVEMRGSRDYAQVISLEYHASNSSSQYSPETPSDTNSQPQIDTLVYVRIDDNASFPKTQGGFKNCNELTWYERVFSSDADISSYSKVNIDELVPVEITSGSDGAYPGIIYDVASKRYDHRVFNVLVDKAAEVIQLSGTGSGVDELLAKPALIEVITELAVSQDTNSRHETLYNVEKRVSALRREVYTALVELGEEGEAELTSAFEFKRDVSTARSENMTPSNGEELSFTTSRSTGRRSFLQTPTEIMRLNDRNLSDGEDDEPANENWDPTEQEDDDEEDEDDEEDGSLEDGDNDEDDEDDAEETRVEFVEELMLMGFPEDWCVLALKQTENDIVNASAWIVDNLEYLSKLQSTLDKERDKGRDSPRFDEEEDDVVNSDDIPSNITQISSFNNRSAARRDSDDLIKSDSGNPGQKDWDSDVPPLNDKEMGRKLFAEMYFPFEDGGFLSNTKSRFMKSWRADAVEMKAKSASSSPQPIIDDASDAKRSPFEEDFQKEISQLELKGLIQQLRESENTLLVLYARQSSGKAYEAVLWTQREIHRPDKTVLEEPGIEVVIWLLDALLAAPARSSLSLSADVVKTVLRRLRCCLGTTNLPLKFVVLRTISRLLRAVESIDKDMLEASQLVLQEFLNAAIIRHSRELRQGRLLFSQYLQGYVELLHVLRGFTGFSDSSLIQTPANTSPTQALSSGNGTDSCLAATTETEACSLQFDRKRSRSSLLSFAEDNLSVSYSGNEVWKAACAVVGFSTGVHSWIVRIDKSSSPYMFVGVATRQANLDSFLGADDQSWGFIGDKALYYQRNRVRAYGETFTEGDCIGLRLDCEKGELSFSKNGVDLGVAFDNIVGEVCPAVAFYSRHQKISFLKDSCVSSEPKVSPTGEEGGASVEDCLMACEMMSNWVANSSMRAAMAAAAFKKTAEWLKGSMKYVTTRSGKALWVDVTRGTCEKSGFFCDDRVRTPRGSGVVVGIASGRVWVEVDNEPGVWFFHPSKLRLVAGAATSAVASSTVETTFSPEASNASRSDSNLGLIGDTEGQSLQFTLSLEELVEYGEHSLWNIAVDRELLSVINDFCEVSRISPWNLTPNQLITTIKEKTAVLELTCASNVLAMPQEKLDKMIVARFALLRFCNMYISRALPFFDLTWHYFLPDSNSLPCRLMSQCRGSLFVCVKSSLWTALMERTANSPKKSDDEYDYPEDLPQLQVNRLKAAAAKCHEGTVSSLFLSLFGQSFEELHFLPLKTLRMVYSHPMDDGQLRSFKVKFEGEGVDDYGGPYREFFSQFFAELQMLHVPENEDNTSSTSDHSANGGPSSTSLKLDPNVSVSACVLPFLMPSPNWRNGVGANREKFVLNGVLINRKTDEEMIGICLRTRVCVRLDLAMSVWKQLVGEDELNPESALETLKEIDFVAYSLWKTLKGILDEFKRQNSKQRELEEQLEAMDLVMNIVKQGLHSIMPVSALALLTWNELEKRMCGVAEVDVKLLQANTEYDEDLSPNDDFIQRFWRVLESLDRRKTSVFAVCMGSFASAFGLCAVPPEV
ncbi:Ubiquitin-associated domain [Phytophthora cactorum]|nr:Ubiquitin-associated domain [Phytophthora cactorum]